MTGAIEERGRLPPCTAFATGWPPSVGRNEKSVSWLFSTKPAAVRPEPKIDSTVVVMDTTSPSASTTTKWLGPPGACNGNVSRRRRRTGVLADQLRPHTHVGRIEQALHGHRHEVRVRDVAVAVGVHESARLREQEPGLRIRRCAACNVGPVQYGEHLQQ